MRCAACKMTWHAEPPAIAEDPIELAPEPPVRPRVEDLQQVKAEKLPSRYRALLQDKQRLKLLTAQALVWGGLAAVLIAILGLAYGLRVDIVRAFPRIGGAYAMVGVKVNATHLEFGAKSADATFKGGKFYVTVKAQVRNISGKPVSVPPVQVKLLDGSLQAFNTVLIPGNGLVVPPHQVRTLTFDVADPKNMTSSVDMDFDLEAMKTLKPSGQIRTAVAYAPAPTTAATAAATDPAAADATPADTDSPENNAAASLAEPADTTHKTPPLRMALAGDNGPDAPAGAVLR